MISNEFTFQNRSINIDAIPRFCSQSRISLPKLQVNIPETFSKISPVYFVNGELPLNKSLQDRISTYSVTVQKLAQLKQNSIRDKILAFIKTAILIGIVVFTILFHSYINAIIFACITLIYLIGGMCLGISLCEEYRENRNLSQFRPLDYYDGRLPRVPDNDQAMGYGLLGSLFGIFIPLYSSFTRISALERVVERQQNTIAALKQAEQAKFTQSLEYYKVHKQEFLNAKQIVSQKVETLRNNAYVTDNACESIAREVQVLETINQELNAICTFYDIFIRE